MSTIRRQRRWLCGGLIAALLFMQLAAAAYACPRVTAAAPAAAMVDMPGCAGDMPGTMDPDQLGLCKAHCSLDKPSPQPAPAADLSAAPVLLAVLDWAQAAALTALPMRRQRQAPSGAPPPGSPPIYLSLLVLRN